MTVRTIRVNVGIVGSRTFTDQKLLDEAMERTHPLLIDAIVTGGAVGADTLGAVWAERVGIPVITHTPNSERYGWPRAAFERNSLIVRDSDMLVAFFGPDQPPSVNKSGTMDTVRKAIAKRIPVHLYFE